MRPLVVMVVMVGVLGVAGCAPSDGPDAPTSSQAAGSALSTEQAQRLAIFRFNNFDSGVRAVTFSIPGQQPVQFSGWVDYAAGAGYGFASTTVDGAADTGLLRFTPQTLGYQPTTLDKAPLPVPADGWQESDLDPSATSLSNVVAVLLSLGNDRPDNPQLLQQTDALWLRSDDVDGVAVDVFASPTSDTPATAAPSNAAPTIRYWIDETGHLMKAEIPVSGQADTWTTVEFSDADPSVSLAVPTQ
ncbi:hypothetical protein SAMN06295943_0103 [Agreia sp. VKM Ac-1783]|nr:hypothetical protein SAMN06295943_0103 [Agreia sp. VKM Ac-1783]